MKVVCLLGVQRFPDPTSETTYQQLKAAVLIVGGFSCFDAGANQYSRRLYTDLCRDPEIETGGTYPWTTVRLKATP